MHCIAEACILRAHPTQRYYLSRQAHPTCISYCRQITYEAHPACGYGPYVPCGQLIQDCVSLSWVSPSNGNVEYMDRQGSRHPLSHAETTYRISRDISPVPAVGRAHMRPIPHVAPELRLTSHLRTRLFKSVLRDMIEQLASRRAYAHVYPPPITKPFLILTRVHPPLIVLGYITCAATDSAIPLHYVEGIQSGTIQAHARRIQHPVLNL